MLSCVSCVVMCCHVCCHVCHVLLIVSLPPLSDEVLDGQFQINDRTGTYLCLGLLVMCGSGVCVCV